jgi:hypothetical protein
VALKVQGYVVNQAPFQEGGYDFRTAAVGIQLYLVAQAFDAFGKIREIRAQGGFPARYDHPFQKASPGFKKIQNPGLVQEFPEGADKVGVMAVRAMEVTALAEYHRAYQSWVIQG